MNAIQLAVFNDQGFNIEDTGGGCQWLRKPIGLGLSLVLTDGEGGLPDETAQLFLMTERHGDPVAKSELMTVYQMLHVIEWTIE